MPKVLDLSGYIETEKKKKLDAEEKRILEAARRILVCFTCKMKCTRCGSQVDMPVPASLPPEIPFHLCRTCAEDYLEYARSLRGEEPTSIPWHNQEWQEMWNTWIEYQKALKKFQTSDAVRELLGKTET
jgi:hypothetical protein